MNSARLLLLAIWVSVGASCYETPGPAPDSSEELAAIPVEVVRVEPKEISPTARVFGIVTSSRRVRMAFRLSGPVADVRVEEGERVVVGQILATLESGRFSRLLRAAEAKLKIAKTTRDEARRAHTRLRNLFASSIVAQDRLDSSAAALNGAEAELELAVVRLDEAEERLANTRLVAPIGGVVEAVDVRAHETSRIDEPAIVISDPERLVIEGALADRHAQRVVRGAPVAIRSKLLAGDIIWGQVSRVSTAADPVARTVPFEVSVPTSDKGLRLQAVVDLAVPVGAASKEILVAANAVLRDADGRRYCFLVERSRATKRFVELGSLHGEGVVIESGLAPGDEVIVRGQHFVRHGSSVSIRVPDESSIPVDVR